MRKDRQLHCIMNDTVLLSFCQTPRVEQELTESHPLCLHSDRGVPGCVAALSREKQHDMK
jgi:hypothetical protein